MSYPDRPLLHLRISAEGDPGVLARVLERFQNLNVTPYKVLAERDPNGTLKVEVVVAGLPEATIDLITAKLGQVPSVLSAHWHRWGSLF